MDEQRIAVRGEWTVSEKINGLWRVVVRKRNLFTYYGLTQLASAIGGQYIAPVYLLINSNKPTLNATYSAGATSIVTNTDPTQTGDTQLVLGAGLSSQEVVTFTGKTGTGPYTFTLSPGTVNSHSSGEIAVRQPNANDTVASLATEQSYDPIYSPNTRAQSLSGYSGGVGNYVLQFYISGSAATNLGFITCGISDSPTIGQGNLHNEFVLGYTHSTTNDIEIDGSITLTNV